jgi:glutamate N-acetyltransferase/amino-acid N-acetyltransferase
MKNKTITSPRGFLAAGIACGIKKSKKKDLGLIVCPAGAKAAAVFTTNKVVSAAVLTSKKHLTTAKISAVVVNSGNANACTGKRGINDAIKMCSKTAQQIESDPHSVLVASTGIIGEYLPMKNITRGIETAADKLSADAKAGQDFAEAIMTTDTKPKQAFGRLNISGKNVTIAGTVKGAGMIAPNMATTLCFITTDAAISKPLLAKALKAAIGGSLNKLTVDGHQSTNDTAIILASALAGNRPISSKDARYKKFAAAIMDICDDLAKQMALDAEGATRMFKVLITGAASQADAAKAARAIAEYPLVKCAVNGADPNWGRIICAVGSCGVKLNLSKLSCKLDNITVFKNGAPKKFDVKKASKVVGSLEHTITVDLGAGKGSDFCYSCDLTKEYVKINADYHT